MTDNRLVYVLLILGCLTCFPQGAMAQTDNELTIIPRFENLSVNEGLSQSSVYCIYQDRRGFMWFGTADGLNRFDGQEIRVFKVNGSSMAGANSNVIRGSLCEDGEGNIWFSNETGIYFYSPLSEKIEIVRTFSEHKSTRIYYATKLIGDVLWLRTHNDGYASFSISRRQLKLFPFPDQVSVIHPVYDWSLAGDSFLFSIFGTSDLFRFDSNLKRYQALPDKNVKLLLPVDRARVYWLSGRQILVRDSTLREIRQFELPDGVPANLLRSVFEDQYGRVWFSTEGEGLFCYLPATHQLFSYRYDNATTKTLPMDYVTLLFVDRNQNLWIGTDGGGVARLDLKPQKFNLFPLNDGDFPTLKGYFTKCFFEDDQKRIWFGTHDSGLAIFDPRKRKVKNFVNIPGDGSSLPCNIVGSIYRDQRGRMVIGHCAGLSLFEEATGQFKNIDIPDLALPNHKVNYVYKVIQVGNGDLAVATVAGLIMLKMVNGHYTASFFDHQVIGGLISDVTEMRDGSLWVAKPFNGLYGYTRQAGTFLLKDSYFGDQGVNSVQADSRDDSILWVGTASGLIRFNVLNGRYQNFDEGKGLANSYVYGFLEDSVRRLWISTNGGLSRLELENGRVENFTVNDGLQSNEFNTGAYYKGPSGNFYFGGVKGFNWFHPGKLNHAGNQPSVAITEILVNEEPVRYDSAFQLNQTLDLDYDKNNLSFQFAALDFTRPQANKIYYMLEGWDKDWITAKSRNVRYANVEHGNYTLKVKCSNGAGVFSNEVRVDIHINAPLWKQSWFYGLSGAMVAGFVVLLVMRIIRSRVNKQVQELEKQKAINDERLRISKDMHDEIGSGLTQIALLSELITTQPKSNSEINAEVRSISSTARKLVQSMGEIVWVTHPQNDTLSNLLAYLREQTRAYFDPFQIHYDVITPDSLPDIRLSNSQRRNIFLVTKEALNNALKHSQASAISLHVTIVNDSLILKVEDNGVGFSSGSIRSHSNGFRNMKARMLEVGGTFVLDSSPGRGTVLIYSLPLSKP